MEASATTVAPGPNRANLSMKNMKPNEENMKSSTTDLIEGDAKIISGKIKEEAGKAIRSPEMRGKGSAEQHEGRVQKKIGEIKKVFAD
jgi:uncharacterized protein YjbJ (UPF0337 family)